MRIIVLGTNKPGFNQGRTVVTYTAETLQNGLSLSNYFSLGNTQYVCLLIQGYGVNRVLRRPFGCKGRDSSAQKPGVRQDVREQGESVNYPDSGYSFAFFTLCR